jgi:hypothetical protein
MSRKRPDKAFKARLAKRADQIAQAKALAFLERVVPELKKGNQRASYRSDLAVVAQSPKITV